MGNLHAATLTEMGKIIFRGSKSEGQIRSDIVDGKHQGKRATLVACGHASTAIIFEDGSIIKFGNLPDQTRSLDES